MLFACSVAQEHLIIHFLHMIDGHLCIFLANIKEVLVICFLKVVSLMIQ